MGLYRASPADGAAWITGASSGIGRRLALDLAREGYRVAASGRDSARLDALAREAEALPGAIVPFPADVTDRERMAETVIRIEEKLGPVSLAIFSAGIYLPARGDGLEAASLLATFETNLFGTIHGLVPIVHRMQARGRGHVALVGSIAGLGGLPHGAAYGASKAALAHMAAALKFDLDRMNIRIQIVNPGFVDTPLTAGSKSAMPGLMTVDDTSRRIVAGLKTGGFEIAFPRRLAWAVKTVNMLPYGLYFGIMSRATGWNRRQMRPLPPDTD